MNSYLDGLLTFYTSNEVREMYGLEPINDEFVVSNDDASQHSDSKIVTNCVNCGAPIDPRHDRCEYCGTNYGLMGVTPENRIGDLRIESDAINTAILMSNRFREAFESISRPAKIIRRD